MTETVVNLPATAPQRREIQTVVDAVPILDTARFEHMQRVAAVMARSSMIPESLRTIGRGNDKEDLPFEQVLSNCFLVVNQAARWGMDPFSVISCCAVVHGRLAYEGKLVAAVLAAKLDISLNHYFTGDPATDSYRIYLCDQPFTPDLIAQIKPGVKIPGLRLWDGSVGEWKTTGAGTSWTPKNYPRMLIYRGTRDWTRIYESAILLGVYTDDELADLAEDARARRAVPVGLSLAERLAAARIPGSAAVEGFSHDRVAAETGGQTQESETAKGGANHEVTPQDLNSGHRNLESSSSETTEAQPAADSAPVPTGAGEAADHNESPSPTNSNSVDPAPLRDQPDTLAAVESPLPAAASNNPEPSVESSPADDEAQASDASPAGLPSGWPILYAAALRRAQKKESLAKYATAFWAERGGWASHKDTEDGATAIAIFDAFINNFGNKEQIELLLREII